MLSTARDFLLKLKRIHFDAGPIIMTVIIERSSKSHYKLTFEIVVMINFLVKFEHDIMKMIEGPHFKWKFLYKQGMEATPTQQKNCKDIWSNLGKPFGQLTLVMSCIIDIIWCWETEEWWWQDKMKSSGEGSLGTVDVKHHRKKKTNGGITSSS